VNRKASTLCRICAALGGSDPLGLHGVSEGCSLSTQPLVGGVHLDVGSVEDRLGASIRAQVRLGGWVVGEEEGQGFGGSGLMGLGFWVFKA